MAGLKDLAHRLVSGGKSQEHTGDGNEPTERKVR